MGRSLRRLLTNGALRSRMALAARARAEKCFGREDGIARYEDLYRRTLSGKRRHA